MKLICAVLVSAMLTATAPALADTLLVERVQKQAGLQMPQRGMSMDEVQSRFGAPAERLEPRGGQKRQWPAIHRWAYPEFIVYFENSRVVDSVANRAGPDEVGPRPVID